MHTGLDLPPMLKPFSNQMLTSWFLFPDQSSVFQTNYVTGMTSSACETVVCFHPSRGVLMTLAYLNRTCPSLATLMTVLQVVKGHSHGRAPDLLWRVRRGTAGVSCCSVFRSRLFCVESCPSQSSVIS